MRTSVLLILAFAVCRIAVAGNDVSASHLHRRVLAESQVASAMLDHEQLRLDAIHQLHQEGNATTRELREAEHRVAILKKQLNAWNEIFHSRQFRVVETDPVVAGRQWLVVEIPGINGVTELAGYEFVIPIGDDIECRPEEQPLLKSSTRSIAMKDLCERLMVAIEHDSDRELDWTQSRRRIADSVSALSAADRPAVWISHERSTLEGNRTADHELRRSVRQKIARAFWGSRFELARQKAHDVAEQLAIMDATPNAFSPAERNSLVQELLYLDSMSLPLRRLPGPSQVIPTSSSRGRISVASQLFGRDVEAADLDNAMSVINRSIRKKTAATKGHRASVAQAAKRAKQLQTLASSDSYFAGESVHTERVNRLATARLARASVELKQLQLVHQLFARLRDASPLVAGEQSWQAVVKNLVLLSADTDVFENEIREHLVAEKHRLTALQTLRDEGLASWKEVMRSEVRVDELHRDLKNAEINRAAYRSALVFVQRFCDSIDDEDRIDVVRID